MQFITSDYNQAPQRSWRTVSGNRIGIGSMADGAERKRGWACDSWSMMWLMLTGYGKKEWSIILALGLGLMILGFVLHWIWLTGLAIAVTLALLSFFRDPPRRIPDQTGAMVSPADGVVSSIHEIEHHPAFGQGAICIRIFLSVLNVHVNRSPAMGRVLSVEHRPGQFMNALNPKSAEVNEATLMVMGDADTSKPLFAVRQVAGAIARRIVCGVQVGDVLLRGQRYGMIKFGSTAELILPASAKPKVLVQMGQKVYGGSTILAKVERAE